MRRKRGFRLVKVFKWCIQRRRSTHGYKRLHHQPDPVSSKLHRWVRSLKSGARRICSGDRKSVNFPVPEGHLAVYVGDKQDDTSRVLVPVIYFNHPLFGELLREAEEVYGFDHPGGIQIPCPKSELDSVQMKIAADCGGGRWRRRRA